MLNVIQCLATQITTSLRMADWLLIFLQTLILLYRPDIVDQENRVRPTPPPSLRSNYDFIIIGGGSAGSVLASRLSENPKWSVLLLEAGPNEPYGTDIPGASPATSSTSVVWKYSLYSLGNDGTGKFSRTWLAGRALGGSSIVNGHIYARGNRHDYDRWEELGNPGWSYEDVLPYFKKSEDMRIKEYQDSPYHSVGGYLTVENFRYYSPLTDYLMEAVQEMGYDIVDVNGANQTGFALTPGTLRDGLRCSAAKAFLRPAWKRHNLHISTDSMVERILVRNEGNKKIAYGVQFRFQSTRYTVTTNREVILSAGTIRSPQVLMLSGIGPRDHLEELNIPVIHDLPGVGMNVQDHLGYSGLNFSVTIPRNYSGPDPFTYQRENVFDARILTQFAVNRTGMLYEGPDSDALGFINTRYANASGDNPDIEVVFSPTAISTDPYLVTRTASYTVIVVLSRPGSKGYIKLNVTDPGGLPIIFPNYFDDPQDLEQLAEGALFAYKMSRTPTMQFLNAQPDTQNRVPSCLSYDYLSLNYWRCCVLYYSGSGYHSTSSCKMGPASDRMAVVDARLRVHGVSGLRVIDASAMPTMVSGNTNAPTIMLAEKGANMIKEDWTDSRLQSPVDSDDIN